MVAWVRSVPFVFFMLRFVFANKQKKKNEGQKDNLDESDQPLSASRNFFFSRRAVLLSERDSFRGIPLLKSFIKRTSQFFFSKSYFDLKHTSYVLICIKKEGDDTADFDASPLSSHPSFKIQNPSRLLPLLTAVLLYE